MIHIGGRTYELVHEHKNAWNAEMFRERYSEVLDRYDYILGDWGYNQLRLKGFFRENHPKASKDSAFFAIMDYVNEYCNFGCAYFVLHRVQRAGDDNGDDARFRGSGDSFTGSEEELSLDPRLSPLARGQQYPREWREGQNPRARRDRDGREIKTKEEEQQQDEGNIRSEAKATVDVKTQTRPGYGEGRADRDHEHRDTGSLGRETGKPIAGRDSRTQRNKRRFERAEEVSIQPAASTESKDRDAQLREYRPPKDRRKGGKAAHAGEEQEREKGQGNAARPFRDRKRTFDHRGPRSSGGQSNQGGQGVEGGQGMGKGTGKPSED